jgi:hypothetical protein
MGVKGEVGPIVVEVCVLDEGGFSHQLKKTCVDPVALMVMAESREALVRAKGAEFAMGAVPHFAAELVALVKANAAQKALEMSALNVAMAAWLADSVFGGLTAEEFVRSDLRFTLLPTGAVMYQRAPAEERPQRA